MVKRVHEPRSFDAVQLLCNDLLFGHCTEHQFRKGLEYFALNAGIASLTKVAEKLQ